MKHDRLDSAACDKVTAWVLGSMTTEERSSFDDHLLGCTVCRNEALALREIGRAHV